MMDENDYVRKIVNYLKKNLSKGYTLDSLKYALIKQGYSRTAVDKAIRITTFELAKKAPILKEKPVINYEVIDEEGKSVKVKKDSWWRRLLGLK